jgi:tetratricopeptide (TPR) repeat protein
VTEAIPLYEQSIELFWNRLGQGDSWNEPGNAYRKLSDYEYAVDSLANANELDPEAAGSSPRPPFNTLDNQLIRPASNHEE